MSNNANIHHTDVNCRFIRAVEEAFFLLNQDQTRSITSIDFCRIAQSVGIDLDSREALSMIRTVIREQTEDHSHETELTVEQYSALMLRCVGSTELNDELRQTFNVFDRDHDGKITRDDLNKLRYENQFFDQLDDEQYELVLNELVIQGNNGLNFDQFVNLMMNQ